MAYYQLLLCDDKKYSTDRIKQIKPSTCKILGLLIFYRGVQNINHNITNITRTAN